MNELAEEYESVRRELITLGFEGGTLTSCGEIHQALRDLYEKDPDQNEDLRDRLYSILSVADKRSEAAEVAREFAQQSGIKGCPACHKAPTITPERRSIQCFCMSEGEGATTCNLSYEELVVSWNDDDSWIMLGADPESTLSRPTYPFSEIPRGEA